MKQNSKQTPRCLFLAMQGLSRIHQAADVELMRRYRDEGYEVWLLECNACLMSCRFNLSHDPVMCAKCVSTTNRTVSEVLGAGSVKKISMDRALFPKVIEESLPATLKSLLDWKFEGVNVGRGVGSTLVSIMRDSDIDLREEYAELIELMLKNAIGAARNYLKALEEIAPDKVIVFNGRHAQTFPMIDLCRQLEVSFITHESGGTHKKFQTFKELLPHSIDGRQQIMSEMWEGNSKTGASKAIEWFEEKRRGTNSDDTVYTAGQVQNLLPDGFDETRHNIVIFNSSEDEMKSIPEWQTPLYADQNDAIRQILEATSNDDDIMVYLRVHPNLNGVDNSYTKTLNELASDNFYIIPPESPISTYDLMAASDKVVAFGSTIGIESTYWGKASILYGHSFYEGNGAVYEPQSQRELSELLLDKFLVPKPRSATFPYGYFVSSNGFEFQHFVVNSDRSVELNGQRIGQKGMSTYLKMLQYLSSEFPLYRKLFKLLTGVYPKLSDLGKMLSFSLLKAKR